MALSCGIVGLPNVGKSTIFNALTSAQAAASNFPFCTIDPNVGVVPLPDSRLDEIAKRIKPQKVVPTSVTFTDIAGLVKGASKGEGLGNQFLGHIQPTHAIIHVVRCFEDENVAHVEPTVDAERDITVIETELMLADLATITRRWEKVSTLAKTQPKEAKGLEVLTSVKEALEAGKSVRSLALSDKEDEAIQNLQLLTNKPILYVANINETDISAPEQNPYVQQVLKHAKTEGAEVVPMCGKIEAEISQLAESEKGAFLQSMGLQESGLDKLIHAAYRLLGLITFFSAEPKEVHAWTTHEGAKAPEAAGEIHTDFQKGFIKAEVYQVNDLIQHGTEAEIRAKGLLRMEGKEYVVKDGDVIFFKFNV